MIYCNDILIYYIDIDSSWVFLFDIGLEIENNIFVFGLSNIVVKQGLQFIIQIKEISNKVMKCKFFLIKVNVENKFDENDSLFISIVLIIN